MSKAYYTVCVNANDNSEALGEITAMFDQFENRTDDPLAAVSCVIQLPYNYGFCSATVDQIDIHMIH